jgi:OmpA-OmpF porin, OOP family
MSSQKPNARPTVQAGREITFLSDVLFRFGSFDLSTRSQKRLDRLAGQIRETGVRGDIQVNGYTDAIGSTADNMKLSKRRALAVARALSRRLTDVDVRLQVQAFGETSPRDTNRTADGRRQNRRVTVVLPEAG